MLYHHQASCQHEHYRTISKTGRILEVWFFKTDVRPYLDYHKIQWLTGNRKTDRVLSSWDSLYDFYNIPF